MENVIANDQNWAERPLADLIDHVVATHHAKLTEELPDISEYVALILGAHGTEHPEIADVQKYFLSFKEKIEQHSSEQEAKVFPLLLQYEKDPTDENLTMVENVIHHSVAGHEEASELLLEIRKASKDYAIPEDACGAYKMVYRSLQDIEAYTMQHFELERDILFKRGIAK